MEQHPRHPEAQDLCAYVQAGPTPYHAVAESLRRLVALGFKHLSEGDEWDLRAGGRYVVTRGAGSLIAFQVGGGRPSKAGFRIIGSHTDSPNLRLKPRAPYLAAGMGMLGVEVYGGVLLHTWLDRDLGIAGRVALKDDDAPDGVRMALIRMDEPLCRVTSLAIHLHRDVNEKGLLLNKQTHMPPIFAVLGEEGDADVALTTLLHRGLKAAGEGYGEILGHDLSLFDLNPPRLGGVDDALIFSPRLDNLASAHASLAALKAAPMETEATLVTALFDHEEVGSNSHRGAASSFLGDTLRRITLGVKDEGKAGYERALSRSFSISADMSHAVHPNYGDLHERGHMPHLGGGPVIKSNVNQRYASDSETASRFRALCKGAGVAFQEFVTRTDLGCGSTIGPITATELGIPTVDVGNPMMSMHSIRELAGSADVPAMIRVMSYFFGARP